MPQSILSSIMENRGAGARSVSTDGPGSFAPSHREGHFKQKSAQRKVDEFWSKFNTQVPGKAIKVLPKNDYSGQLGKKPATKDGKVGGGKTAQASFKEAAALCRAKVAKIVEECRRVNQKYRDPHFDLEFDLKTGRRDCLESLNNETDDESSGSDSEYIPGPRPRPRPPHGFRHDRHARSPSLQDGVFGSTFKPRSVKRVTEIFDDPKFYVDGPTANDVRQGRDGDCWLMAALCNLSNKPGLIERLCVAHNQDVGVYGFVFHRDGEWFSEIIDDKLYLTKPDYDEAISDRTINIERMLWEDRDRPDSEEIYRKTYQSNSGALYFAQCENPNETWLPLLEKAYAKAHGDYAAIEGGFTGEGIEDLTGGVTTGLYTTDILDKEYFWREELMKVNEQFLFGCATGIWGRGYGHRKGIQENHAYSIMRAVEMDGERLLLLKNPWGKGEWTGPWSDGSKEWTPEWLKKLDHRFGDDGAFWISYKDFLRKYQAFDRTRLFTNEWKFTALWTTLSVPWTLEYHSTRFAFTLAKRSSVVLVLSQLDDRYFRGLEGPYKFSLSFRVHKAGADDYLVRSQSGSRMTRSTNVELDLEAGEYHVLVKIDAQRLEGIKPAEVVVRENAKDRREKLMRIGLAYDLAHAKATIRETPEEKAAREKYEKRKKEKYRAQIRKAIMEQKEMEHHNRVRALKRQQKREQKHRQKQKEVMGKRKAKIEKKEAERRKAAEKREAESRARNFRGRKGSNSGSNHNRTYDDQGHNLKDGENSTRAHEATAPATPSSDVKQDTPPASSTTSSTSTTGISPTIPMPNVVPMKVTEESVDTNTDKQEVHSENSERTIQTTVDGANGHSQALTSDGKPPGDTKKENLEGEEITTKPRSQSQGPRIVEPAKNFTPELERNLRSVIDVVSGLQRQLAGMLGDSSGGPHGMPEPPGEDLRLSQGRRIQELQRFGAGQQPVQPPLHHHHHHHLHPHGHGYPEGHNRSPSPPPAGFQSRSRSQSQQRRPGPPPRPYGRPPPPPPRSRGHHHYTAPRRPMTGSVSGNESPGSDSDDDSVCSTPSISSISDISERELDYQVQESQRQLMNMARGPPRQGGGPPGGGGSGPPSQQQQGGRRGGPPNQSEDELDAIERDPWNAVAVVGLRVYYKVVAGGDAQKEGEKEELTGRQDGEGSEDEDEEIVTLRVVRPNRYELGNDDNDSDEKEDDKKETKDREKAENKSIKDEEAKGPKEHEKENDEAKVLDIDDSAKDATLDGEERKHAAEAGGDVIAPE